MNKRLENKGKELAYLLRHDKSYQFDEHGYRTVSDLIENHSYTMEEIEFIVENNNKKRFEFNDDKTLIRARQGHSVEVNVDLNECVPPDVLYHGTATRFIDDINKEGLKKQSRMHVHLSADEDTAIDVGKRHGKPIIIKIDAKQMSNDGCKFYLSNNGVWLTEYVDTKYFID